MKNGLAARRFTTDRLVAAGVFVYALVVYLLTMAETTSFWDSGEFIAIAAGLQVSHPPGAPFYMIVGRFFAMLAPLFGPFSPEPVAFAVNLVSVLASAATVLLTHLIIVRLVRVWKGHPDTWTPLDRLAALGGGAIGALTFAVSDAFWFNAVEAEVYALSMLFTALVVWMILVWRDETVAEEAAFRARGEHPFGLAADRYLVGIAYLFGLAIGVHLLNVLTLFFLALIVFFEKAERPEWTTGRRALGLLAAGAIASVMFFVIYPGIVQTLPSIAGASGSPALVFLAVAVALAAAVWWTNKQRRPLANLVALGVTVILIGYSSYAVIFVRSAADPPIDENDPETADAIVSYLKREQYGSTPLLRGPTYDDATGQVGRIARDPRTGQPIVEGGYYRMEESLFPRRHSSEPSHVQVYSQFDSDSDFFWRYQMGYMYWRYFLWNFVGKAGDFQGAPWVLTPGQAPLPADATPSLRASRLVYFGLPLLLGLVGLAFHFLRDSRRALAVLVLFLVSGVGIILYLNQTPLQPRERDYSYVASFFAFALWIGLGATGLVELVSEALGRRSAAASDGEPDDDGLDDGVDGDGLDDGVDDDGDDGPVPVRHTTGSPALALGLLAVLFVAVPGWMLVEGYDGHDRSGRRLATEFAVNMLESTAPNAILFTNGDNDTFPLWYAQEVLGVRRDVRVVNLSLLNTPWYIKQLRNQWSRASAPLPMGLTNEEIDRLGVAMDFQPTELTLPVPRAQISPETMREIGVGGDRALPAQMTWRLEGRPIGPERNILYIADRVVLDVLAANAQQGWARPVYFASTVGRDSELGLQPFFQNEGLARRVTPLRAAPEGEAAPTDDGRVTPDVLLERLGRFRFTNLADPAVYYDENERNLADSYRSVFALGASALAAQGRADDARALLARITAEVPFETIPADFYSLFTLAEAHRAVGDRDALVAVMRRAEDNALAQLSASTMADPQAQQRAMQFVQFVQGSYLRAGAYAEASAFLDRLADAVGDDRLRQPTEALRAQGEALRAAEGLPPDGAPGAPDTAAGD